LVLTAEVRVEVVSEVEPELKAKQRADAESKGERRDTKQGGQKFCRPLNFGDEVASLQATAISLSS
jgi:hypothetical protein